MMTDDELRGVLNELALYEGRVAWPYLDSAKPPNVTIGVGCLVPSAAALADLPLVRRAGGQPAMRDEKMLLFARLLGMSGGLRASKYRFDLQLTEAGVDALGVARLRRFLADLPIVFDGFAQYPMPAQEALLDLAWNCGLGAQPPGLRSWRLLRAACARRDWLAASRECTTTSSRPARNAWRVACFRAAAGLDPRSTQQSPGSRRDGQ